MSANRRDRTFVGFTDPTATTTWTEVSDFVRRWSWSFGRQVELDAFQTGQGSITFDNVDYRFDPLLTNGPYAAGLVPMRRFKVEGWWNLLTVNQASLETDTAGWVAGSNTTITRSTTVAQDGVASLRLSSTAAGNVSATTPTGTSGIEVVAGEPFVGMASFRAGASARSCRVDLGWYSTAGVLLSTTTGATITSATGSWAQATTTATAPAGGFVSVIVVVQSTAAGSELHYVDEAGLFPADVGTPAWSAGGPYPVANGFIPSWEPLYNDVSGGTVTVPTVDGMAVLAQADLPESAWLWEVVQDAPYAWWRLGEAVGVSTMVDSSGNGRNGTYGSGPRALTAGLITGSSDGAQSVASANTTTDSTLARAAGVALATTAWSVEMWLTVPTFTTNSEADVVFAQFLPSVAPGSAGLSSQRVLIEFVLSGVPTYELVVEIADGTNTFQGRWALPASGFKGSAHHIVLTRSGATATLYIDGSATAFSSTTGSIAAGGTTYGTETVLLPASYTNTGWVLDEVATYTSALSAARVSAHRSAGLGWPGDDSGTRAGRVLDTVGWPTADRVISVGASVVQTAAYNGGNALAYLQQLARTEQGRMYVDQSGRFVFASRWTPITASRTSLATFGDSGSERGYAELLPSSNVSRILNHVSAQRVGGALLQDWNDASKAKYFGRSQSATDLLYLTDLEVADFIAWRLNNYAAASVRLNGLSLEPVGVVDLWDQVYGRGIGDRITVKHRLPDGTVTLNADFAIEGVTHQGEAGRKHRTSWYLSVVDTTIYFVLDDATAGVLNTAALAF